MKASKWTHPTTGEVRVYLNGFKGDRKDIKAFAISDKDGNAVVTVTGSDFVNQKNLDNIKSDIRKHFGLYVKFEIYLNACAESAQKEVHAYGSIYANNFERATGCSFGE